MPTLAQNLKRQQQVDAARAAASPLPFLGFVTPGVVAAHPPTQVSQSFGALAWVEMGFCALWLSQPDGARVPIAFITELLTLMEVRGTGLMHLIWNALVLTAENNGVKEFHLIVRSDNEVPCSRTSLLTRAHPPPAPPAPRAPAPIRAR